MTNNHLKFFVIFSLLFAFNQIAFAAGPETISLNSNDFPWPVKLITEGSRKNTSWAGWVVNPNTQNWSEIVGGFAQSWELSNGLGMRVKYGHFSATSVAKYAAEQAITHMYPTFPGFHVHTSEFSK